VHLKETDFGRIVLYNFQLSGGAGQLIPQPELEGLEQAIKYPQALQYAIVRILCVWVAEKQTKK